MKKTKAKKEESASEQEDEEEDEEEGGMEKNDDGDSFLRLSNNRRVTVRKFKGATLIDIREVSCSLYLSERTSAQSEMSLALAQASFLPFSTSRDNR